MCITPPFICLYTCGQFQTRLSSLNSTPKPESMRSCYWRIKIQTPHPHEAGAPSFVTFRVWDLKAAQWFDCKLHLFVPPILYSALPSPRLKLALLSVAAAWFCMDDHCVGDEAANLLQSLVHHGGGCSYSDLLCYGLCGFTAEES